MVVQLREAQDGELPEVSEINVTPFIDVILVLLIIFMVAAPLSTVDVVVDLPISNAPSQPRPDKPVFLTIKADLSLAIGNEVIAGNAVGVALDAQTGRDREQRVYVRADGGVVYRDVMGVMNALRQSGYLKIGLVGLEDTGQATGPTAPSLPPPEQPSARP